MLRATRILRWLVVCVFCFAPVSGVIGAEVKLARHPDYHNGKVVFSYLGDLWLVNEDGSYPQRLTVHRSRDVFPRFSPDGKWIAFSSARYGNSDVFVMPAGGGKAKQLTFHSAPDNVVGWSRDSRRVIFTSSRGMLYPGISNLYEVPVAGGIEEAVNTDWGAWGSYSPDGKKLAFTRHPMPWYRKHYRGSYAADLWVLDLPSNSYHCLVDNGIPDDMKASNLWPMFGNGEIYFVSDRHIKAKAGNADVMKSTNNIWKVAQSGGEPVQVTQHPSGNLFAPSMSADGKVIVYEYDFGIWKMDVATGKSTEIKINIATDDAENNFESVTINSEADSYHLSPSGKRAVISASGELFTIATEKGDLRRLTQSPGARDTQPQWSRDGKWIAFISDKSGADEVWLCDEEGKNQKRISSGDSQKGQPVWSPDSKALLYPASDNKLYKYDLVTGQTTVVASNEVVAFGGFGVTSPQWSPDGKWISFTQADKTLLPHVYVVSAAGGMARRITDDTSYSDSSALWTPDGKRLVYLSGMDVGNIGGSGRSTAQLYTISLVPEDRDPSGRGIDSEEDAARQKPKAGTGTNNTAARAKVEVKIDFNRMGRRARQLTKVADAISSVAVSLDSQSVLFVTSGVEGGRRVQSIWSASIDGGRVSRVLQAAPTAEEQESTPARFGGFGAGLSSLQLARDGRTLFYKQGKSIYSTSVSFGGSDESSTGGARTGRTGGTPGAGLGAAASAGGTGKKVTFTARIEVDRRAQRKQVFGEAWRVMKHRFYAADMHGADWLKLRGVYEPLLDHVADTEELHTVVNQMLGELNASHTGISGGFGGREERGNSTRFPGFELQSDKSGYYKVKLIYKNGPADKDYVKLSVGNYILAIDEEDVKSGDNYWRLYNGAASSRITFTVNSKPAADGAWKVKILPITSIAQQNLQYQKWVDDRVAMVERLSGGDFGYLHIRQMNEASLRQFEKDLMRLHTKKALIIDQRFNPGGNIDQELLQILGQRQYQKTKLRGSIEITRPLHGFFGPMVVLANERSTSDAEVFPDGFRTLKLGKVVGVTTYGAVIGTGSYSLMDGSAIRTPGSGLWNVGGINLENYGVPPDVYVDNSPADFFAGRDAQLEKAVEVLRGDLAARR